MHELVMYKETTPDSREAADGGSSKGGVFSNLDSTEKSAMTSAGWFLHRLQIATQQ